MCVLNKVSVSLLTYNSRAYLSECLESVLGQTYPRVEVVIVDNRSSDGTVDYVREHWPGLSLYHNTENVGYSAGHNRGIRMSDGDYVLVLNPDVVLQRDCIGYLVEAIERDERAGAAMGKLYTWGSRQEASPVFDSVGVYIRKNRRTLDRGQGEADVGQYDEVRECFGASGAVGLYRRAMLEDVRLGDEYFDEDFFAYREEVDLAWRSRLLGWTCVFEPRAVGYHDRTYTPRTRSSMPGHLRRHMLKNRYLLLLKDDELRHVLRHLLHIVWFELRLWGYTLLTEPHLMSVVLDVLRLVPRMLDKRKQTMARRRTAPNEMLR